MRRRLVFSILDLWTERYGLNLYLCRIRAVTDDSGATHRNAQIIFHESVGIASLSAHKFSPAHYGIQDHEPSPSSFLHTT